MTPLDELALYLRPPGQGVYTVSTGRAEFIRRTEAYLGDTPGDWRDHLAGIGGESIALLGVPSDAGAGFARGAAFGPLAIREALGRAPAYDLGDVFTVPHFIDDQMLSRTQIEATQDELFGELPRSTRRGLPVAPLSVAKRVYELLTTLNPRLRVLLLGGDHTVTWAAMAALLSERPEDNQEVGVLHFDAHTDLMPSRLGVRYCFATWAFHTNQRLGGGGRLLQVGLRMSRHDRASWEDRLGVRQIWSSEARAMGPAGLAECVVQHFRKVGAKRIFVSNDIDGTDSRWAGACGTPERDGLTPAMVLAVLAELRSSELLVFGADLVEVAPGLSLSREQSRRTVRVAADYARASLGLFTAEEAESGRSHLSTEGGPRRPHQGDE